MKQPGSASVLSLAHTLALATTRSLYPDFCFSDRPVAVPRSILTYHLFCRVDTATCRLQKLAGCAPSWPEKHKHFRRKQREVCIKKMHRSLPLGLLQLCKGDLIYSHFKSGSDQTWPFGQRFRVSRIFQELDRWASFKEEPSVPTNLRHHWLRRVAEHHCLSKKHQQIIKRFRFTDYVLNLDITNWDEWLHHCLYQKPTQTTPANPSSYQKTSRKHQKGS